MIPINFWTRPGRFGLEGDNSFSFAIGSITTNFYHQRCGNASGTIDRTPLACITTPPPLGHALPIWHDRSPGEIRRGPFEMACHHRSQDSGHGRGHISKSCLDYALRNGRCRSAARERCLLSSTGFSIISRFLPLCEAGQRSMWKVKKVAASRDSFAPANVSWPKNGASSCEEPYCAAWIL